MKQITKLKEFWRTGTVFVFDENSGEGLIKCDENRMNYYVHYTAIDSKDKWKTLTEKSKVRFQLFEDTTFSQVTKVKEL